MIISAAVIAVTGCGGSTAALPEASCMAETVLWEGEKRGSIFTGPDNVFTEPDSILMETDSSKTEEKTESVMGSVPYFRDDAGKSTQIEGDYLYGYWNNRLCRYDLKTLEETVLYEAASSQHGDFCIWGDYVYFMEVPHVNSVGKFHGYLCRVRCDGSEKAVRLTSVAMPGQEYAGNYYQYYKLDTYQDILYLMQQYGGEEALCFRLNRDGSIARVDESETLYGQLPEGDFTKWVNYDGNIGSFMSLPYAMRNYGYVFMKDENDDPVRIDLDSRQVEVIEGLKDYTIRTVTNDAVIASKDGVWYRIPLDDIHEMQEIGDRNNDKGAYAAWDAEGLYFTDESDGYGSLYFMDWEGEKSTLGFRTFLIKRYSPVTYFGGGYYYYVAESQGNDVVRRMELTKDKDKEMDEVSIYEENPFWEMITRESTRYGWTDTYTGARVDYSITEVFFKEETGAYGRINDFLEGLYTQDKASLEEYKELVKEESEDHWEEWGAEYVEYSDSYQMCYMDEKYVGVSLCWDQYWKGGAHGMHGTVYYIFDRNTGSRVSVTDIVNNSPEEICEIIAPYVEAAAVWGTDDEGWESIVLEEGRFFLSEEGIGIHFDVYEIDCYAAGEQEIIVPYRAFD